MKDTTTAEMRLKRALGGRVEARKGLVGERVYSMGLVWKEVCILHKGLPPQERVFIFYFMLDQC
jgi:hypothetical protein